INVAQKDILRVAIGIGQIGDEAREDVQMELDGVAHVQIFVVTPAPVKSVAAFPLEALKVNAAAAEQIEIFIGKILADDADDSHGRKEARAHGEIGRRAAQDALGGA